MSDLLDQDAAPSVSIDWMRELRPGHAVELWVYGRRMAGRLVQIGPDNVTLRVPVADQSVDVQRYSVCGTAMISLDSGAANVPVSVRSVGDLLRLQFIGPAELVQRRRSVRRALDVPVTLCWLDGQVGVWERAVSRTKDISAGGLRVACGKAAWPRSGTAVLVALELSAGAVQAHAEVIGKTPGYDLRLSFTEIGPEDLARIKTLTG
jgi:hypothetical protein